LIAKLKGIVDQTGDDWAVIDVNGVGYLAFCSGRTLARLQPGAAAVLFVETHVREDHIHLYGFADAAEKEWFRLLTTVQGVGSKVALAILSVLPPEQLLTAIAAQDKTALTRASGVGPKLAARVVAELKDKAALVSSPFVPAVPGAAPISASAAAGSLVEDAVSALVNLGYRRIEAHPVVVQAAAALGEAATVQGLIRAGLKELGAKEPAR
jgi:Holliday junction DNA helicase RuvA